MGFLDRFRQQNDVDSGLDLPDDDGLDEPSATDPLDDEPNPTSDISDTGISSDPNYPGSTTDGAGDDDLHGDVQLVLEKLDTVKSQLQHVQSKLDKLEAEHGKDSRGSRRR